MHYKDSVGLVHLSNIPMHCDSETRILLLNNNLQRCKQGPLKKILKRIQIELDFVKYSEKMGYRNWYKNTQIFLIFDEHNTLDNNLHIK